MVTDVINLIGPFIWTSGCDPMYNCQYLGKGLVINYGEGGGGYKMGKSRVRNFLRPPSRQGKTFCAPPFKEWKLFVTPLQYG